MNRTATALDVDAALTTLVAAFTDDPVWGGWAFPHRDRAPSQRRELFALWLRDSLYHEAVQVTEHCEAVTLWYPPGGLEDSPEYRRDLRAFADTLETRGSTLLQGCEMFAAAYPAQPRFWYLALIGVSPQYRGRGLGMALLHACLESAAWRELPAYLESTNPRNDPRYQQLGFRQIGSLTLPGGPTVRRMWREPASRSPQSAC